MLPELADDNDFTAQGRSKQDENLFVKFEYRTRPDKVKSKKEGRPCFKDVEYVDIRIPGMKDTVCRPASDVDRKRFPRHYEAFKNRTGDLDLEGTPLREWTGVNRSMAEELAFVNILTVEQLATTADVQISKFMNGFKLRERAKDYVEQMKSEKPFREIKLENEEMKKMVSDLQATVANLAAQIDPPAEKNSKQVARDKKRAESEANKES